MRDDPRFPTIRQYVNRGGPFSEYYLRLMLKQGKLPGFYVGSHYRINVELLMKQLNEQSVPNGANHE